jgi:hypothetical protein
MTQLPVLCTSQGHSCWPVFQCFLTKEAGTAVVSSLGDCSSFASLSQYCILTGNGRAVKLHDGAPLIGIDAVTYRANLFESLRGSGYELAVLICPLFRVTTGV